MIKIENNPSFNIIIVGTGGTGSHLVSFLSQLIGNNDTYKVKHNITLIDGDIVEEKNLRTQKFLPEDVGRLKAEVLADRYSGVFGIDIGYIDKYIESENDIKKLLEYKGTSHYNIIVSCVDNNKARRIIDNVFNDKNVRNTIYIDTGNSSGQDELVGQTVVGYKAFTQTVLPSVSTYFPEMLKDEEPTETISCAEAMVRNIQNIGANITSACNTFNILNNIIGFNQITSDLVIFNATNLSTENMAINVENIAKNVA